MKNNNVLRMFSLVLAVIVMVTSIPSRSYAAAMDEPGYKTAVETEGEELIEEDAQEDETPSETILGEEEETDASEEDAVIEDDSAIEDNPAIEDEEGLEDTEESSEEILEETQEETVELETKSLSAEKALELPLDEDTEGEGWSFDVSSQTLTLDGAELEQLMIYDDIHIVVESDSTIENTYGKVIEVTGPKAENVSITGTGKLTLIAHADAAAIGGNNDKKTHNITISGNGLTVDCINDYAEGYPAIFANKGIFEITDEAVVNAEVLYDNNIVIFDGTMNVTEGGVLNITGCRDGAVFMNPSVDGEASLNVDGAGSKIYIENASDAGAGIAINAHFAKGTCISVTDGGKVEVTNYEASPSSPVFDCKEGAIDIRGGLISVNTKSGSPFQDENMVFRAATVLCNNGGLVASKFRNDGTYDLIETVGSSEKYLYAELIKINSQPAEKVAVKSGETVTLSVDAEIVNTDETPTLNYQWYKDDVIIAGATDAAYTTPALADGLYTYKCVVSAAFSIGECALHIESKVAVNSLGKFVRTEPLNFNKSDTKSEADEAEGWSWDQENKTLTLDGLAMEISTGNNGIEVPLGTIIVLKGTNKIDMLDTTYPRDAIYCSGGSGNLVIRGGGTLDITTKIYYRGIYSATTIDIWGEVEAGNLQVNDGLTGQTQLFSVWNSINARWEVRITTESGAGIVFTKVPEEKVAALRPGDKAPTFSVEAKLLDAEGDVSYAYQWYATDYWNNPKDGAVAAAKGKTFTAPATKRGGKYYFCEVTATCNKKTYKKISDIYAVVVGANGLLPITKTVYINDSTSIDHMKDQGWSFDKDTCTLTLSNVEAFIPYARNTDAYYMFSVYLASDKDFKVVVADGSLNYITDCCRGIVCSGAKSITFTGEGVLNYGKGSLAGNGLLSLTDSVKKLDFNGGVKVNSIGGSSVIPNTSDFEITVEDADVTFPSLFEYSYGKNSTVHVAQGGTLNITDLGENYAKNIVVDKGGALYVRSGNNGLIIDEKEGVGTISVAGILSITASNAAIKMYGADPDDRITITDSVILDPAGKTLDELKIESGSGYQNYCKGNLLIAPSDYAKTKITGVPVVSGDMKVGSKLTAGTVTPANATVSYMWQHALSKDAPEALWQDIYSGNTYTIDERYAGEYIRVKIVGDGKYTGTVYSQPTQAVATTGVSVADFVVDSMHYGRLTSAYENISSNYYPDELTGTVHVKVIPDDKNAEVIIKNITTGFDEKTDSEKTIIGAEGELPVKVEKGTSCSNKVEITVVNGGKKAKYTVNISYCQTFGSVTLTADEHTSVVLTDDDDNEVLKADRFNKYENSSLPAGNTYKLTAATDLAGWYVSDITNEKYRNDGVLADGKWTVSITVPNGKGISFGTSDAYLRCSAPEATVGWVPVSVGQGIQVRWDDISSIYKKAGYTGRLCAAVVDENGKEVKLAVSSDENPEGFYSYDEAGRSGIIYAADENGTAISFDVTKNYTLKLWCDAADKNKCDIREIPIPATDLQMNRKHLVIEKPTSGTKEVDVAVNGKVFGTEIFPDTVEHVYVYPAPEEGKVTVSVGDEAKTGSVYVVVYAGRPDGTRLSETLTIDIIEAAAEVKACLTKTNGTMNIYSNQTPVIPINVVGSAKAITSAKFVNSDKQSLSDKYTLQVGADREVEIVPIDTPDTDKTDWAKVAKSYTGTFKAKIEVELEDGTKCTTKDYYSLTVTAKAPKVTAKAAMLNSFYVGNKVSIAYKAPGTVREAKIDAVKTTKQTQACPEWTYLADSGKSLVVNEAKVGSKKKTGKVYLKVWVDGYRMPAQISVSSSAAYTAPKIKLAASTVTLPMNRQSYSNYLEVRVVSNDKKVAFENMNITNLRVINAAELATLDAKSKAAYAISKYFIADYYDKETGVMKLNTISGLKQIPAGKVLLYAEVGGKASQKIALPLTVKTVLDSKVTLKMNKKSITFNSNKAVGSEEMVVSLVPSAAGFDCREAVLTVTDVNGKGDYKDHFAIYHNTDDYFYNFRTNASTKNGTYKVNIKVPGIAAPATMDIVVKATVPTLKADKKSVNVDLFGDYKDYKTREVTVSLSDKTLKTHWGQYGYKIYNSKGKAADDELYISFSGITGQPIVAAIGANSKSKNGKYSVNLIYNMDSGAQSVAKITVNVKSTLPKIKPSKTAVTLNKSLGANDMATIKFTRPDSYSYVGYGVDVYDKNNKPVMNAIKTQYNVGTGILTMYPDVDAKAGMTYKVVVGNNVGGEVAPQMVNNTITVKMLAINKSSGKTAITQKLKTTGAMDISRMYSRMNVIPSYTGWTGETAPGSIDVPEITWTVYAYSNKKPYQYGDTDYQYAGSDGKVASSDGTGDVDWFIDTDSGKGISLGLNSYSKYVNEVSKLTDLTYKIEVKTTFKNYSGSGDYTITSAANFKVKSGEVKLSAPSPSNVILSRYDKYDSKVVKIKLTDKDALELRISGMKLQNESLFDATLLYVGGNYAYVAIGWKNDTVDINLKSGKQTLEFYTGYNYIGRGKCNGSVVVNVNIQ